MSKQKSELTQSQLKAKLSYAPQTGVFTKANGKPAGTIRDGCLVIHLNKINYVAHQLAWLYVYGHFPVSRLDHVNGIRTDNRIKNLSMYLHTETSSNISKTNKSGYKGVYLTRRYNGWMARITVKDREICLGVFATAELAFAAREAKARELYGEFYRPSAG